ncbi:50S ribosomal protein L21 [Candidatus Peregrinibacteria bacterium]|nr:50S ribosomal protein L21 [Candidatus Peregrinibacteria bacterium]
MFAIIELGGKQYKVKEKDILRVEKLAATEGKTVKIEKVLLKVDDKTTQIGTPFLAGAYAEIKVLKAGLGDKVRTFKMKAKKRYKRLKGHRQPFSEIEIVKI